MKFLSKLALISISCFFAHGVLAGNNVEAQDIGDVHVFSNLVETLKADSLTLNFFQTLEKYPKILMDAVKAGDVSKMESIVEKGSPWYIMLETCKEHGQFAPPSAAGGIPYYTLPFFSYMVVDNEFHKHQESIKVYEQDGIYEFSIKGISIFVTYKDEVMKFYRLRAPDLMKVFNQQLF